MTKESLKSMDTKQLRTAAKGYGIVGRWDMTREQLVDAIIVANASVEAGIGAKPNDTIIAANAPVENSIVLGKEKKLGVDLKYVKGDKNLPVVCGMDVSEQKDKTVIVNPFCEQAKAMGESSDEQAVLSESKRRYIINVEKGTIVAFRVVVCGILKVKSAAVENISVKREVLKLVTKAGIEHIVKFDDVVWVRTGKRWPKGVYELLKGLNKDVRTESKQ